MKLFESIPLIDDVLGSWSETIGRNLSGYKNHVYWMVNFTCAMGRSYRSDALVEAFRKGDLVDFSPGLFKCGLPFIR